MSTFWNWLRRLFGHRPNPTQALREDLARFKPQGRSSAPPLAEPPASAKASAQEAAKEIDAEAPPAARPTAASATPKPSPSSGSSSAAQAPSGVPAAPGIPRLTPLDEIPKAPKSEPAAPAAFLKPPAAPPPLALLEEPIGIPEPAAAQPKAPPSIADPIPNSIPDPQPPPNSAEPSAESAPLAPETAESAPLPPISLLAPPPIPKPIPDPPPHNPRATKTEDAAEFAPLLEHSEAINPPLSTPDEHEGMTQIAPASAALHPASVAAPAVFDAQLFDDDHEDLVDLSLVDEDMETLDARAVSRGKPTLAAPPLDMLVARWRVILARLQGSEGSWALFKHGTVVIFDSKPRNAEAEARDLLRAQSPARYGAPEPEVTPLPNNAGWLVGGAHARLLTYVAPEEAGANTPLPIIGRLGRAKREEDARDLDITHIENDPFWRHPED